MKATTTQVEQACDRLRIIAQEVAIGGVYRSEFFRDLKRLEEYLTERVVDAQRKEWRANNPLFNDVDDLPAFLRKQAK